MVSVRDIQGTSVWPALGEILQLLACCSLQRIESDSLACKPNDLDLVQQNLMKKEIKKKRKLLTVFSPSLQLGWVTGYVQTFLDGILLPSLDTLTKNARVPPPRPGVQRHQEGGIF